MIVLDTNVVSEAMKPEPHPSVKTWLNDQVAETLYLSSVTLAEMMYGIGALPEAGASAAWAWSSTASSRCSASACWPSTPTPPITTRRWPSRRAPPQGLPMADGYIAAIAAAGIRRRHPRRRALSGSGHCRHQSLGRVLASIRDRTNIVTETAFSSPAGPALLQNLESLGFTQMTPIQAQSLPLILEGRDLIAQAKTGSGKTAAFGLGLLQKINPPWLAPQCLVLCPRGNWPTRWRRNCAGWRARSPTSRC